MKIFERIFFVRLLLALIIVVPPTIYLQRSMANEAETRSYKKASAAIAQEQTNRIAAIAQETINRTIDQCNAANDQRTADIARTDALIRAAAETPHTMISDRDRLLLTAFVERAERAVEGVTRPKVCTVQSLHLQDLTVVAADGG